MHILCLNIGNTHIYGGVFINEDLQLNFRYPSKNACTSDQLGLFLKAVLRENKVDAAKISGISMASVAPSLNYSVTAACIKYFNVTPLILKPGIKTGLKLHVKNPLEVGADRIANAVAATEHFPNKHVIVIDFGTATTLSVIAKDKEYLGGAIMPGLKVAMDSLHKSTEKLSPINIIHPKVVLGKTTEENIQSGLYYSQLGAIKEILEHLKHEVIFTQPPAVIATGGYAHLFEQEKVFTVVIPDLVLQGLRILFEKNRT